MSTTNKGYTTPSYNSEVGTWGGDIVSNFTSVVDLNVGGFVNISLSSSNVTLSTGSSGQMQNVIVNLTGTLLANVTVYSSSQGFYFVENLTTGSFTVTWQANFGSGGVGTSWALPQGSRTLFISDSTNGARPLVINQTATPSVIPAGSLQSFAGSSAPNGWLLCYGQAVSRTLYPYLYTAIGTTYGSGDGLTTFNVPDLRGRFIAGLDNMGGSAAGRLTGSNTGNISSPTTLGSAGGEENHTVLTGEMPSHSHLDSGHTHSYTYDAPSGSGASYAAGSYFISSISSNTGTGYANIQNTGGGGSHNTTPPAMVVNWLIKF